MMILTGIIVWLFVVVVVLKFFAVSSEVRRIEDLNKIHKNKIDKDNEKENTH